MWKRVVSIVVVVTSYSAFAAPAPTTVVNYFNTWSRNTSNRWQVIQKKSEWIASDSQWGDDVFVPVTVDVKNGFLSFKPNSGDSEPLVMAALFRSASGKPSLLVSDNNINDTLSTCDLTADDLSSSKPVNVIKNIIPTLSWKDFFDDSALVTQIQNYKPIQKYLMVCYTLPQVGTTIIARLDAVSLSGEVERYGDNGYRDDGSAEYKSAMAHLPLMRRVANIMAQKKISLKWDKDAGRFTR